MTEETTTNPTAELEKKTGELLDQASKAGTVALANDLLRKGLANEIRVHREDPAALEVLADLLDS